MIYNENQEYKVKFYTDGGGKSPVLKYIERLSDKEKAKVLKYIEFLSIKIFQISCHPRYFYAIWISILELTD